MPEIKNEQKLTMKKYLLFVFGILVYSSVSAQAYHSIRLVGPEYVTNESFSGIVVSSVTPQEDGSYCVEMFNSNRNTVSEQITNSFEWYLSYKGKRVSDYFNSAIRGRSTSTKTVWAWPDEVPKGNEKYVTAQFGRERTTPTDRRDDVY